MCEIYGKYYSCVFYWIKFYLRKLDIFLPRNLLARIPLMNNNTAWDSGNLKIFYYMVIFIFPKIKIR